MPIVLQFPQDAFGRLRGKRLVGLVTLHLKVEALLLPIVGQERLEIEVLLAYHEVRVVVEILCLETSSIAILEQAMAFLDEMNLCSIHQLVQHHLVVWMI